MFVPLGYDEGYEHPVQLGCKACFPPCPCALLWTKMISIYALPEPSPMPWQLIYWHHHDHYYVVSTNDGRWVYGPSSSLSIHQKWCRKLPLIVCVLGALCVLGEFIQRLGGICSVPTPCYTFLSFALVLLEATFVSCHCGSCPSVGTVPHFWCCRILFPSMLCRAWQRKSGALTESGKHGIPEISLCTLLITRVVAPLGLSRVLPRPLLWPLWRKWHKSGTAPGHKGQRPVSRSLPGLVRRHPTPWSVAPGVKITQPINQLPKTLVTPRPMRQKPYRNNFTLKLRLFG